MHDPATGLPPCDDDDDQDDVTAPLELLGARELARLRIVVSTEVLMPAPAGPGYVDEPAAASLAGPARYFTDDGRELAGDAPAWA